MVQPGVYPTWRSAREQVVRYAARRPEETPLYRLVFHYREQFEYCWEEHFSERYGILRDEVLRALDRYLNCGILRHGCALACCENGRCNHSMLIAFSCKRRGVCPSCQAKRGVLFAENLHENVLMPLAHRHLVFSLPKRMTAKISRRFINAALGRRRRTAARNQEIKRRFASFMLRARSLNSVFATKQQNRAAAPLETYSPLAIAPPRNDSQPTAPL
jgi:hypothetical protein